MTDETNVMNLQNRMPRTLEEYIERAKSSIEFAECVGMPRWHHELNEAERIILQAAVSIGVEHTMPPETGTPGRSLPEVESDWARVKANPR
jgi:hypothetical protein